MLHSYRHIRRVYKMKFTDKLKANLWIYLDLAKVHHLKELTSSYIVSYLHFLNLNNILTLLKLSSLLKLGLIWHGLCLPRFLPAKFTRMWAILWNQNKCKPSLTNTWKRECNVTNQSKRREENCTGSYSRGLRSQTGRYLVN